MTAQVAQIPQIPQVEEDITITLNTLDDVTIPGSFSDALNAVAYTDEDLHALYCAGNPDGSGIEILIQPTTPSDYLSYYVVLRGKYEYKRGFSQEPYQIIYVNDADTGDVVRIYDNTVEPLSHYYYSILVQCLDDEGNAYYRYNELTSFSSAYRYKDFSSTEQLSKRLPNHWFQNELTERLVQVFGKTIDAVRSDLQAYLPTNTVNVQEKFLPYLAHLIGWEVNRELNEVDQRREVQRAINVIKSKGTNQNWADMVDVITGWNVDFESGYDRVARCGEAQTPEHSDNYARSHVGLPWRNKTESFGTSDGTADQTFTISTQYPKDVTVYVAGTAWLEVEDLSTSGASDQHFSLTAFGASRDVVFGDGTNGAIPANTSAITASFKYAGDSRFYTPQYPEGWINDCGVRVIVEETEDSEPMNATLINKVNKIVHDFKPVHTIVSTLFIPTVTTDETPFVDDDYDAYTEVATLSYITDSTSGETSDLRGMVVA